MGKSHIFSFQISGRKATTVHNGSTTSLNTPISKVQRILGTEVIDLNIQTLDKATSHNEYGSSIPTSLCAQKTTLSRSSMEEIHKDTLPIVKAKASSILGIFKDQTEGNKPISPRARSTEARTCSQPRKPKREEFPHEKKIAASKQSLHLRSSDIESKTEYINSPQFNRLAHIATYIDQDMSTTPELPGDNSMEKSVAENSLASQNSRKFNCSRPTSSSSCPVATEYQKWIPGKSRDTCPREFVSSQGFNYPSARPQFRSKNRSLPNAQPPLENTWSMEQKHVTRDRAVDQSRINSSPETKLPPEESDIPIFLRSSRRSMLANKYELEDSSCPEIPYLKIPEFADIQLSGPWNENLEDQQAARTSYFQNSLEPGCQNSSKNKISSVQCTPSTQERISLSHSPVELYSPLQCDFSTTSKESKRATEEPQHYLNALENDKITLDPPSTSCLNSPVSVESQTESCLSIESTTSTNTSIDDEREFDQKIPLFPDSYLTDWNNSPISSLCIDYDSASSATILKNEPAYQKFSDKSIQNGTSSDMYSPTVLMEVARVGLVIQKTPVREMIRGRRKGNLSFEDIKELPSVNVTTDFSLGITSR
ncbi:hypothetical protein GcM3_061018 [Golovinomyces cichoracearum]|uniref:Uncharacterized protein n=1 Tax=Golovinomyces cichoracearum TaxID=62708 RepID=A0A420IW33_9PEZI|nr:hypothetical protein GcM3_061018 [Golovinomyces cichoracearum]